MKRDNSMTRRYLEDAGVTAGMRVMEIGCGSGDVTRILADLVGPSGAVVAIDRSREALAMAQERMKEHGIGHVRFMPADVSADLSGLEPAPSASFDALAGRRVLMYLQDPAGVLRRLAQWLRTGALVVFEEADATMVPARTSPLPAHDQATEWLKNVLIAEGANTAMGFDLPATLARAGFRFARIRAEAVIRGQGTQYPLSDLLELMRSRIVSAGIASKAEIDAIAARLHAESRDPTCVYVSEMSFCAWAYAP